MVARSLAVAGTLVAILVALNYSYITSRPEKKVFMTLLTNAAYLPGVLTLDYSLKQVASKYPLVVMYTDTVDQTVLDALEKRRIRTKRVKPLLPASSKDFGPDVRFNDCWSKLLPHGMIEYKRIVELDADMLVRRNIDDLIEMDLPADTMAASHACVCNPRTLSHYPADWLPENCAYTEQHANPDSIPANTAGLAMLNGGLQVLNPNRRTFDRITALLANETLVPTFDFADQSLLSHLFRNRWIPLSYTDNALKTLRQVHAPIWKDEEVRVVHYILSPKPWHDTDRTSNDTTFAWWHAVNDARLHAEKLVEVAHETEQVIGDNKVVLFSKSYCPHCRSAKQTLKEVGAEVTIVELDQVPDGGYIQQYLLQKTGQRTVPSLFMRKKHMGGNSDLQALKLEGKLAALIL